MNKNLIYLCVFYNRDYIKLLELFIQSLYKSSNIDNKNTDILIITSNDFYIEISQFINHFDLSVKYFFLELNSVFDAGCARLNIFDYEYINNYDKILYLDTDILINNNINNIFDLDTDSNKIYALEEGFIYHDFWGGQFFDLNNIDKNTTAFSSGILYFNNNITIKNLFEDIKVHIHQYIHIDKHDIPRCLDQPFIIYNSIIQNKYDNKLLIKYVKNILNVEESNVDDNIIVYHFPGDPGNKYSYKYNDMVFFNNKIHAKNTQLNNI
jgi:lipopolysaccharide biosynthesis glycosyltransferase